MRRSSSHSSRSKHPLPGHQATGCRQCRRFVDDAARLEAMLPGILILSSAQGCSRGDNGICEVTGRLHAPLDACEHFEARSPGG